MSIGDYNSISTLTSAHRGAPPSGFPPADATRQKVTREFAAVLAGIVYRLRKPLLTVALLPVPASAALLAIAVFLGGPFGVGLSIVAAIPLLLGAWLVWQRQQMLAATNPMEELAQDVGRVFDITDAWSYAAESAQMLAALARNGWGPFRILRGIWTTVQLGPGVMLDRVTGLPRRIYPFVPRRLQITASVAGFCLMGAVLAGFLALILGSAIALGVLS